MTTGEALRAARKSRKLTQRRLSELTGISEVSLRNYEYGKHVPRLSFAIYIADALDMSLQEAFAGVPAPYKKQILNESRIGISTHSCRRKKHLSMDQLAHKAYCSRETIWRIESGLYDSQIDTLITIASALGVTLDEYIGRV